MFVIGAHVLQIQNFIGKKLIVDIDGWSADMLSKCEIGGGVRGEECCSYRFVLWGIGTIRTSV